MFHFFFFFFLLERRIMHAGQRARLVAAPTPKPLCLLHRAVQRSFQCHGPVLTIQEFAALCSTCQVPNVEAARRLLHERGSLVELGASLFSPQWLGEGFFFVVCGSILKCFWPPKELCNMALHGAPSAQADARLHDVLRVTALERNLVAAGREKNSVIPFCKLAVEAPPDASVAMSEVSQNHLEGISPLFFWFETFFSVCSDASFFVSNRSCNCIGRSMSHCL